MEWLHDPDKSCLDKKDANHCICFDEAIYGLDMPADVFYRKNMKRHLVVNRKQTWLSIWMDVYVAKQSCAYGGKFRKLKVFFFLIKEIKVWYQSNGLICICHMFPSHFRVSVFNHLSLQKRRFFLWHYTYGTELVYRRCARASKP